MPGIHTGAEAEAHRTRQVVLRRCRSAQQHGRHHTQIVKGSCAAGTHGMPPRRWMKSVELYQASPGHQHGHERTCQRVHMRNRKRSDEAVANTFEAAIAAEPLVQATNV